MKWLGKSRMVARSECRCHAGGAAPGFLIPMLSFLDIHQSHVRLMYQRSRLQGLSWILVSHFRGSELPKLLINERHQPLSRPSVAFLDL
jgi:hypothetical protein